MTVEFDRVAWTPIVSVPPAMLRFLSKYLGDGPRQELTRETLNLCHIRYIKETKREN